MESTGNNVPVAAEIVSKRRSQADKVGKHKYELQRMDRIGARIERIEQMQRIIFHGLSGYFKFDRPLVEKVCCESELDLAVVSSVYESGPGILTKNIIDRLRLRFPKEKLERHKVQRIVNRVNKNSTGAFGRPLIEKRGKRWAFTEFGFEIWGKNKKKFEDDKNE